MENEQTKKPQQGAWDKMKDATERKPRIEFEFDKPVVVTLNCSRPKEIEWEDSVFYVFDVFYKGEERSISTSAWSLLKALTKLGDLSNRRIRITKRMVGGKQQYFVEELGDEEVMPSAPENKMEMKIGGDD